METVVLKTCSFLALLSAGWCYTCEIPTLFHGSYYTSDLSPYEKVHINLTHITSQTNKTGEVLHTRCEAVHDGKDDRAVTVVVTDDDEKHCIHLIQLTNDSNVIQWKRENLHDVRTNGGNPCSSSDDVTDTQELALLYNIEPQQVHCHHPFHLRQPFSYRIMDPNVVEQLDTNATECHSVSNAFHPLKNGTSILMQMGSCSQTMGGMSQNVTLRCLGVWQDDQGVQLWGVAKPQDEASLTDRYHCMWAEVGQHYKAERLSLKLSEKTVDCSRTPTNRKAVLRFDIVDGSSGSSRHVATVAMLPLLWLLQFH